MKMRHWDWPSLFPKGQPFPIRRKRPGKVGVLPCGQLPLRSAAVRRFPKEVLKPSLGNCSGSPSAY